MEKFNCPICEGSLVLQNNYDVTTEQSINKLTGKLGKEKLINISPTATFSAICCTRAECTFYITTEGLGEDDGYYFRDFWYKLLLAKEGLSNE